jgi:hypothetical protein
MSDMDDYLDRRLVKTQRVGGVLAQRVFRMMGLGKATLS